MASFRLWLVLRATRNGQHLRIPVLPEGSLNAVAEAR